MISRRATRSSSASSGVAKILRDEGSGLVVTAGTVASGLGRMFITYPPLFCCHFGRSATRTDPKSRRGGARFRVRASRAPEWPLKLKRAGRRSRYRLRKQIVETVFGQIKRARGFRKFLVRRLDQVRGEWAMICTAHNLLKLVKARRTPAPLGIDVQPTVE